MTNETDRRPAVNRLNDDLDQRVVSNVAQAIWLPSPEPGVDRRMLDRNGGEIGRSTSIVRFAAGAKFSQHAHGGGEEILVLEGVLSDEYGSYPAGSYVRNPPGSVHTPFSRDGCVLFVKLWQFAYGDHATVRIDTRTAQWLPGLVPGLSVMPLHEHAGISTALVRWAPQTRFSQHVHPGGEEILVLDGLFVDEDGEYCPGTWLRNPRWSRHTPSAGPEGALIYVKVGHLGADLLRPPAA
jgi:anti-sigma factor ChrR (cupin superfamily)